METATPPVVRTLSRRKILVFVAVLAVFVCGITELAALAAFRFTYGVSFSYERLQNERRNLIPKELPPQERAAHLNMAALHPYLGFVTDPDQANHSEKEYSEHGLFRLDDAIQKRQPGKVIIGIMGGSVATHFSQRGAAALRRELEESGRFSGKQLVLVNLANGGYKQPQQLMALNYFLAQGAEFDILVNLDGFNEIALHPRFNAEAGVFPIYPVNWRGLTNVPDAGERELIAAAAVHRQEQRNLAKQFSRTPWRFSVTANFLWKCLHQRAEKSVGDCQLAMLARRQQATYQSVGPRSNLNNDDTDVELVAIWQRCSVQLDRLCRANGITYYHFLQPNQYVPGSKKMNDEERAAAFLDNHSMKGSVERCYPRLTRVGVDLKRQGIRFHDLTMLFAERKEPIYYDTCCHINAHGNEIMAGAIARVIAATAEPPLVPMAN